jgi:hypothetical protein
MFNDLNNRVIGSHPGLLLFPLDGNEQATWGDPITLGTTSTRQAGPTGLDSAREDLNSATKASGLRAVIGRGRRRSEVALR